MAAERKRPAFFWIVLLACPLYAALAGFSVYMVSRHLGVRKEFGWDAALSGRRWLVSVVDPAGPAAARLKAGDRLLSLDGDWRSLVLGPFQRRHLPLGASYGVDVERDQSGHQIELRVGTGRAPRATWIIYLLVSLGFFGCGAALGFLRPKDLRVRLFAATAMTLAVSTLLDALGSATLFLQGRELYVLYFMGAIAGWQFPLLYHFFSRFPSGAPPARFWRVILLLLYVGFAVLFPMKLARELVTVLGADGAANFFSVHPALYAFLVTAGRFTPLYLMLSIGLALLVAVSNYRQLSQPGDRRRVRWVVAGLVFAALPWLALMFAYRGPGWISRATFSALYPWVLLFVLFLPALMAYAVLKNQLFDIRVVVRRGLQYLLAQNALRAVLLLPIGLLAASILRNPHRTLAQFLSDGSGWTNLIFIGAIGASLWYRKQLGRALDRRFFRDDYRQEHVLMELIDEIRQQESIPEIARLVSDRIGSVLHPTSLRVFSRERDDGEMVAGYSSSGVLDNCRLSEEHALLRVMGGIRSPQDFPFRFDAALSRSDQTWLAELGVRLIVPILDSRDNMIGLLMLGEKMSDEPYSSIDRRLLQAVASQIGAVCERRWLRERVQREESTRREESPRTGEQAVNLLKECPRCGACYDGVETRCGTDGAILVTTLPVERTIEGKYRLERLLGRGAMGACYEAEDLRLQRRVAVKVMTGTLFGDQRALQRFEREARAAGRLDHPHITRVHDYGTIGSDGAYMVMELLRGRTWRVELEQAGALDPIRAAEWFRQLLDGVAIAHQSGIVHRDLKPENVMVTRPAPGTVVLKILDFGLAKLQESGSTSGVTSSGAVMGTLGYMSPEQLSGEPADKPSDLFAIGVMVVEALTGSRPFRGRTEAEVIAAVLHRSYHLPGDGEEVRALNLILQRCLAKDPAERYGSATEMSEQMVPAIRRCPRFELKRGTTKGSPA